MLDRQAIVGKTFAPHSYTVTREAAWAYACATNDKNPRYESGALAPPMFAVVLEMPSMISALQDPEVIIDPKRFLRLLHGEHDLRFFGKLVPGRLYDTSSKIQRVAEKGGSEIIEIKILTVDKQTGEVVIETISTLFIRGESKDVPAASEAPPRSARVETRTALFQMMEEVAADQSLRYADASGDHNPIHKDLSVAKRAGLPDIILHGLCSLAFCQKAIINQLCDGEAERLKRLKVRFAKPVLNGQTLSINAFEEDSAPWSRTISFDARVGDQIVLKDGIAELSTAIATSFGASNEDGHIIRGRVSEREG